MVVCFLVFPHYLIKMLNDTCWWITTFVPVLPRRRHKFLKFQATWKVSGQPGKPSKTLFIGVRLGEKQKREDRKKRREGKGKEDMNMLML